MKVSRLRNELNIISLLIAMYCIKKFILRRNIKRKGKILVQKKNLHNEE